MAARTSVALTPEVRDVLERSTITADSLVLPAGQLDRKLYEAVNKVLTIAGGKWNRSAKAHVFATDPRAALGLAVASGEILDKKKALQQFFTPEALARQVAGMLEYTAGMRVLEPSAGHGALARAVDAATDEFIEVHCIDVDPSCADKVKMAGLRSVVAADCRDFLALTPDDVGGLFDAVVANPPFTKDQDIHHVEHALTFLRPGGTLVAIMSPGFTFGETRVRREFRALVERLGGEVTEVAAGTFAESGTDVRTVLVRLQVPA